MQRSVKKEERQNIPTLDEIKEVVDETWQEWLDATPGDDEIDNTTQQMKKTAPGMGEIYVQLIQTAGDNTMEKKINKRLSSI